MTPSAFYNGFSKQLRTVVDQIATEEIAAAQKRIELRVREQVQNYSIEFQDSIQQQADRASASLSVTVTVNFQGLTR